MSNYVKPYSEATLPVGVYSSNPGSDEETVCVVETDINGVQWVQETDHKKNIQAEINSHLEETDLSLIVSKLMDMGINVGETEVNFEEVDPEDVSMYKDLSLHDVFKAQQNKQSNENLLKAKIQELEAKLKENKKEVKENE